MLIKCLTSGYRVRTTQGLNLVLLKSLTFILFQVVWNILYDTESAANIGTLHAARNFLNARNVPLNPMDNVDATFDFLEQYTDAMILATFEEVKGQGNNTRGIIAILKTNVDRTIFHHNL